MLEPYEIWGQLSDKYLTEGEGSLTSLELAVFRTSEFMFLVQNGGLAGFLYNKSPTDDWNKSWTELAEYIQSLTPACPLDIVKILKQAQEIVESKPTKSVENWADFLDAADTRKELPKLEANLYDMIDSMHDDFERFTVTNCS